MEEDASRLAAWQRNWEVTREHWLFGTGPAGYAVYYMSRFPHAAMASHSNYVDVLSQAGIVGVFFFSWFLVSLFKSGMTLHRRLEEGTFASALGRSLLSGFLGVVVAMLLGDWLLPFIYTGGLAGFDHAIYSWILLGIMVALSRVGNSAIAPKAV
jgi:O-antigen ligase